MGTFFQAWRRRQAEQQAADWTRSRRKPATRWRSSPTCSVSRRAAQSRRCSTVRDEEVAGALEDLDHLLEPHPELSERFFRLRVVDDAVEFLARES